MAVNNTLITLNNANDPDQTGLSYDNSDVVTLGGINDGLSFSRSEGSSFIATGTNQTISVAECGHDNTIYDLGEGLTLSFYELNEGNPLSDAFLQVRGFNTDLTGQIDVLSYVGQTASTKPDGHGGTWLDLSGNYGGIVHFMDASPQYIAAHLTTVTA